MPTVPTTFVPQVTPPGGGDIGQFQAPAVEPMRNYTGEQVQQFGQQLTRAGMTAFSIGDAMQDQIDEAAAKESDVAFLQQANEIMRGQNGYLNTAGKDAETSYVSVNEQLIQAGQASMDRLNEGQKRLYQNVLARNMMTFQAQVQTHRDQQVKVYAGNEATARANQYVNLAIQDYKERDAVTTDGLPTGAYNTNLGVALNEIRTVGRLRGYAEDSAQMRELENAVYTQAAQGVVNRLMMDSQYQDGLDYVRKQLELNRIDPAKADAMIASLDANRKRQMVDELTTSIRTTGVLDTPAGTGNFDQIIENGRINVDGKGVNIEAPPGAPVNAPANGTVTSVDGNTVTIETTDDTTLTLNNVDVFGMLTEGQTVTRGGLLGMVGKDDAAEDGLYRIGYTATRNGEAIDPRNLNSLDNSDRDEARRPLTLRDALTVAERIPDPEVRKQVQSNLRTQFAQEDALIKEEYRGRMDAITEFLAVPGNNVGQIPPQLWGTLKPTDQAKLLSGQRETDELGVMEEIARDPSVLTVDYLDKNRNRLTPGTYVKLLKDTADPSKMAQASVDADQLESTLVRNGLDTLAFPNSKDKDQLRASLLFRDNVKQAISYEQTRLGRSLNRDEKQHVIDTLLLDRAFDEYGESNVIAAMTPEQASEAYADIVAEIPTETQAQIRMALQANGQAVNQANMATMYLEYQRRQKANP
jgi:murein DD-endopeptidase MepM/ murein hydrolase activator NlpD